MLFCEKGESQKIDVIRKEDYTLIRMHQDNPKLLVVVRDEKDYGYEGEFSIIYQDSGREEVEMLLNRKWI